MHACVLVVDLRLPTPGSLKDKRAVITPILQGAHRRHHVATSEVARQDDHRRAELAFATVGSNAGQVRDVLDAVDRFVWSFPEVEVLDSWRRWVDDDDEEER